MMTTINEIKESCFVAWESTGLLDKKECALCSKEFDDENCPAHGLVAVSLTTKDQRSDFRFYFPFYHLVCKTCYEFLDNERNDMEFGGITKVNTSNFNIPEWSWIRDFIIYGDIRPSGLVSLEDPDSVFDLLQKMYDETHTWEDFNEISWGQYEELLPPSVNENENGNEEEVDYDSE